MPRVGGACMAGGVHGQGGVCVAGGVRGRGVCVVRGACVAGGCVAGGCAWPGGVHAMHPTGLIPRDTVGQ